MTPPPNEEALATLREGPLEIRVSHQPGGPVRLDWLGRSQVREPGQVLEPFLIERVHEAQVFSAGLEMHFEAMEHFNSATIAALVRLMRHLSKHGIALALVYDPALKWQRLSFEALRVFEGPEGAVQIRTSCE